MTLQQVRAFCAIVAEGSFSRAAERLHLTQPTISAQIQGLEKALGVRLLERLAQGARLTQPGREFHPLALQIVDLADRAADVVQETGRLDRGSLELAGSSVPAQFLLPEPVAHFKVLHPGLMIRLNSGNSQEVRARVRDGRCDLGFVGETVVDERLVHAAVAHDRLVVAVNPRHPLARRRAVGLDELLRQRLVVREEGSATRHTLERAMHSAGVPVSVLKPFLELGSIDAAKAVVRAVEAVTVLSEWAVRNEVRLGLLVSLELEGVDLTRRLYAVRRAQGALSHAAEAFLEFLSREQLRLDRAPEVGQRSEP